tara:strand:+ start:1451 stop:1978 length:528 start_codon:yes stop_codon:yes gene_type:complete
VKKEHEIIDLLMRGNLPRRPLKEWERREIFSKIGRLRASAVEKEDYAMKTTSDRMARRAEEDARELRKKADLLEKNAAKLGIKKSKPTMENKQIKITKRQLKRIIKEEKARLAELTDQEAGRNLAGRLEDVAAAQEQIEVVLNALYDSGVENEGLIALLNNIIRDIDSGFVGEPS